MAGITANPTNVIPLVTSMVASALKPFVKALEKYNNDYQPGADFRGNAIQVPFPDETVAVRQVQAGPTPQASPDVDLHGIKLEFLKSNWFEVPFTIDDFDRTVYVEGTVMKQIDALMQQLIRDMERRVLTSVVPLATRAVSRQDAAAGGHGAVDPPPTLFGAPDAATRPLPLTPITNAAMRLTAAEAPLPGRCFILNEGAYYQAVATPDFQRANFTGQRRVEEMGLLGYKLGFDWELTGGARAYDAADEGTADRKLVNHAAGYPAGATSIVTDGPGGTFKKGDAIGFARSPYTYMVAADSAGSPVTIEAPGLIEPIEDNDKIHLLSKGRVRALAMHRDFVLFATKIIPAVAGESMNARVGPLWVRVVTERQSDQTAFKVQVAPAWTAFRSQFGIQVIT